jgi:hypothetical protein
VAYEPALTSFILAGTVGGLALVMSLSADWEVTHELARATRDWSAVMLSRSYDREDAGSQRRASREAAILLAHGYERMTEPRDPAVPDAEDAFVARGGEGPAEPIPEGPFVVRYRLVSFPA